MDEPDKAAEPLVKIDKPKKENPWPEDVVGALYELLQKRFQDNLSFKEIGARIGRTKGQVMGYVGRHFPEYQDKHYRPTLQAAQKLLKLRKPPKKTPWRKDVDPAKKKPPTIVKMAVGGPVPLKKPMTPVNYGECSYVYGEPGSGEWAYCGHKTKRGSSYCSFHYEATKSQYQPVDREIKEA